MPVAPRLSLPVCSPEATLPKSEFPARRNPDYSESFIQSSIFRLDRALRRWQHIFEFCQADDCLLRVAVNSARKTIPLPDGHEVRPGDQIVEIHWWNEHVAWLIADRPALARAKLLPALVEHSFEQLAKYVATAPQAKQVRFIHGNAVLPMRGSKDEFAALVRGYGFWVVPSACGYFERMHDFLDEYLVRALLWAFHRRKTRKRKTVLKRVDLWTTRTQFLARYRPSHAHAIYSRQNYECPLAIATLPGSKKSGD